MLESGPLEPKREKSSDHMQPCTHTQSYAIGKKEAWTVQAYSDEISVVHSNPISSNCKGFITSKVHPYLEAAYVDFHETQMCKKWIFFERSKDGGTKSVVTVLKLMQTVAFYSCDWQLNLHMVRLFEAVMASCSSCIFEAHLAYPIDVQFKLNTLSSAACTVSLFIR